MTPQELRAELTRLNMTQAELARLSDADDRTIRRWVDIRSDAPLAPGAVARIQLALKAKRNKRPAPKAKVVI
jgi:hypothetical protein